MGGSGGPRAAARDRLRRGRPAGRSSRPTPSSTSARRDLYVASGSVRDPPGRTHPVAPTGSPSATRRGGVSRAAGSRWWRATTRCTPASPSSTSRTCRACSSTRGSTRARASSRCRAPRSPRPASRPTASRRGASPPAAARRASASPGRSRRSSADLEIGGYGTARNTSFEVLGVPVAWLPWMIYPLKTERQTGLLFPEISAGSLNSFGLGLPFFWAARENVNVLLTPGWSVKRGPSIRGSTEYVYGEESSGERERGLPPRHRHRREQRFRALRARALGDLGRAGRLPARRRAREERIRVRVRQPVPVRLPRSGRPPQRPLPGVERLRGARLRRRRPLRAARHGRLRQRPAEPRRSRPRRVRAAARAAARLRDASGAGAAGSSGWFPRSTCSTSTSARSGSQNARLRRHRDRRLVRRQRARPRRRAPGQRSRPRPGQLRDHRRHRARRSLPGGRAAEWIGASAPG